MSEHMKYVPPGAGSVSLACEHGVRYPDVCGECTKTVVVCGQKLVVEVDPSLPPGTIIFKQRGVEVGRIENLGIPEPAAVRLLADWSKLTDEELEDRFKTARIGEGVIAEYAFRQRQRGTFGAGALTAHGGDGDTSVRYPAPPEKERQ